VEYFYERVTALRHPGMCSKTVRSFGVLRAKIVAVVRDAAYERRHSVFKGSLNMGRVG
jgi:hypothetical protein